MSELLVSRDGPVLRVVIDRAHKRNALARTTLAELRAVFGAHDKDPELKLAVLTGAGDRAFAAGGDLIDLGKARTQAAARKMSRDAVAALGAVRAFPVPVIAALNGLAIGGGAELALACDFRVAAPHAEIGFVQGKLNIGTAFGGGTLLVDLLGPYKALAALATSRVYAARGALEFGLIDAVARKGETLERTVARFAAPILAQRPQVLRAFKALVLAAHAPRPARERLEIEHLVRTWTHADHWQAAAHALPRRR